MADAATEPPAPADVASVDELFFIGQYLHQYRHATRFPEPYWQEALRRDPGEVRSNIALAERMMWAGRNDEAETMLRTAIDRLVARVSNPADGEAHYRLGILLVRTGRDAEAEGYLAKASWNSAWRVPARLALARLKARARDFAAAGAELTELLAIDGEHLQAADLLACILRETGRGAEAEARLAATLAIDPLDQWARDLAGLQLTADAPTLLDVALEYAAAGFTLEALRVLDLAAAAAEDNALGQVQVGPLVHYHRAALLASLGRADHAREALALAQQRRQVPLPGLPPRRYRRPDSGRSQLDPNDELAAMLLGNWHYDKRNYTEAIEQWERSAAATQAVCRGRRTASAVSTAIIVQRNLGIAAHNVLADGRPRQTPLRRWPWRWRPADAKLLYELDQLGARLGESAERRLERLEASQELVVSRDDLTIVFANLLTAAGRAAAIPRAAAALATSSRSRAAKARRSARGTPPTSPWPRPPVRPVTVPAPWKRSMRH